MKNPETGSVKFNVPMIFAAFVAYLIVVCTGCISVMSKISSIENIGPDISNLIVIACFAFFLVLGTGGSLFFINLTNRKPA